MIDKNEVGDGMLTEEQEIYRENILDHYKHPHNAGVLNKCSHRHRELNPLCGDEIEVFLRVNGTSTIKDVKFTGKGCAISQASMSMLTEKIKQQPVNAVKQMTKDDVLKMLGIPIGVVRMNCALLGLKAVHKSLGVKI